MNCHLEHLRERKTAQCLSDFQLDCAVAGEGEYDTEHLKVCGLCREKLSNRRQEAAAFGTLKMPELDVPFAGPIPGAFAQHRQPLHRWQVLVWIPLAASAMVIFGWIHFGSNTPTEKGHHRIKGKPSFGIVVKRGEHQFVGSAKVKLRAGDQLRFRVSTDTPRYFALFNVEQSGKVTQFIPTHDGEAVWLQAGRNRVLPGTIELDASVGREYLVGVFCDQSFGAVQLQSVLDAAARASLGEQPEFQSAVPENCIVYLRTVLKERSRE